MIRKKLQDQLYAALLKLLDAAVYGTLYTAALMGAGLLVGVLFHSWDNSGVKWEGLFAPFLMFSAVLTFVMWIAMLMGLGERR